MANRCALTLGFIFICIASAFAGCSSDNPSANTTNQPTQTRTADTAGQQDTVDRVTSVSSPTTRPADAQATTTSTVNDNLKQDDGSREGFSVALPAGWQYINFRGGLNGNHYEEFNRVFQSRPEMQSLFQQYVTYADALLRYSVVYLAIPVAEVSPSIPFDISITITKVRNDEGITLAELGDENSRVITEWSQSGVMRSPIQRRVGLPAGDAEEFSYLYETKPGNVSSPIFGSVTYYIIHNESIFSVMAVMPAEKFDAVKLLVAQMMQDLRFSD